MSYTEKLLELAKAKGVDTEQLKDDLVMVAIAMGGIPVETVAESFIRAIQWEPTNAL